MSKVQPAVTNTILGSVAGLTVAAIAALVTSLWLGPSSARAWHIMCWFMGIPAGFALGLVCSPLGEEDKGRLSAAGQVAGGFLSGFAVSKIDKLFEKAVERGAALEPTFIALIAVFSTSALATAISVFLVRSYLFEEG